MFVLDWWRCELWWREPVADIARTREPKAQAVKTRQYVSPKESQSVRIEQAA